VPNQRAKGQKLIAVPLEETFLEELDRARGGASRSAFVREAIYRLLRERGVDLPPSIKDAPDRTGKGGRPTHAPKEGGAVKYPKGPARKKKD
jgi:hypothetical protein